MMHFEKACDRIDRMTMTNRMRAMNVSEHFIELVELLYTASSAIMAINNEK